MPNIRGNQCTTHDVGIVQTPQKIEAALQLAILFSPGGVAHAEVSEWRKSVAPILNKHYAVKAVLSAKSAEISNITMRERRRLFARRTSHSPKAR